MSSKRTKTEMIRLFRVYAYRYRMVAREAEKSCRMDEMQFALGKADAYDYAAFELEHNMNG